MAFIVLLYLNFRRFIFFPSFFFFYPPFNSAFLTVLPIRCVFESRENFLHACCWHTEKFFSFQFFFYWHPFSPSSLFSNGIPRVQILILTPNLKTNIYMVTRQFIPSTLEIFQLNEFLHILSKTECL